MAVYRVIIKETHYRTEEFDAVSEEDARQQAEAQDWSKWPIDKSGYEGETEIVEITKG